MAKQLNKWQYNQKSENFKVHTSYKIGFYHSLCKPQNYYLAAEQRILSQTQTQQFVW